MLGIVNIIYIICIVKSDKRDPGDTSTGMMKDEDGHFQLDARRGTI